MEVFFPARKRWLRGKHAPARVTASATPLSGDAYLVRVVSNGDEYLLPVARCSCSEKYAVMLEGSMFCEAEYCPGFLEELLSGRFEAVKLRLFDDFEGRAVLVGAVAEDATNPHVAYEIGGRKVLLKGYRLLRRDNPEPLFLEYLSGSGVAPRLFAAYSYGGYTLGVFMELVEGAVDPGSVLYATAVDVAKGVGDSAAQRDLLGSIGEAVAGFHLAMERCTSDWCAPSPVVESDVELWYRRMLFYLQSLAEVVPGGWLSELRRRVEGSREYLQGFVGSTKLRIHQDLHFSQMLFKPPGRVYLLDFEGEPGRPQEFSTVLEPAARDLASLARSLSYIAFFSLKEAEELSNERVVEEFVSGSTGARRLLEWSLEVLERILGSYASRVHRRLFPADPGSRLSLLHPWVLERALYEAYYEKMYRPENVYVALSTAIAYLRSEKFGE
ncbi:hypothetical protein [Thermofilum pendens]|uniref:Uncharacterized protein probably involved in trehalose biosynthesis-like protein n=1 Tax=Thermofilum pendens (strain DSM 2475 / Hrk 5) TaxID=368408 RepID=A1RYC7_THEPD|nr:hypothetical protein [Thermofilum pendens]ABL78207.1 Uncharacterized protein probably involved in trehalose biosynthesis-like protein [Thermofilum pendens Hrk 5]